MIHEITSFQNPLVKQIQTLQKKRERRSASLFLVEGKQEVSHALTSEFDIETLCFCRALFSEEVSPLLFHCERKGIKMVSCPEAVFRKISYRENPDGLLAIVKMKERDLNDLKVTDHSFFIILESLEKPGNLGAILRSAEGAGAEGAIIIDEGVDLYNPNVIYASRGAFFTLATVTSSNEEIFTWLRKNNISIMGASPEARESYTDFSLHKSLAIVMGREHEGLSPFWKNHADYLVRIPMAGQVDSLNVSVASALLLFEAKRWMSQK